MPTFEVNKLNKPAADQKALETRQAEGLRMASASIDSVAGRRKQSMRRSGGIGRHAGLKIPWVVISVPVRPRSPAPEKILRVILLNIYRQQCRIVAGWSSW